MQGQVLPAHSLHYLTRAPFRLLFLLPPSPPLPRHLPLLCRNPTLLQFLHFVLLLVLLLVLWRATHVTRIERAT